MAAGGRSRIELLQGTLDFIILQTLRWGPQHGFGIGQMIRANSSDALQVDTGSLYPALHRLERAGWIDAKWDRSEKGQHVRVYRITPSGRKRLATERTKLFAPSPGSNVGSRLPGPNSSSSIVTVSVLGPLMLAPPVGLESVTVNVSFPSTTESSMMSMVIVFIPSPSAKLTTPPAAE